MNKFILFLIVSFLVLSASSRDPLIAGNEGGSENKATFPEVLVRTTTLFNEDDEDVDNGPRRRGKPMKFEQTSWELLSRAPSASDEEESREEGGDKRKAEDAVSNVQIVSASTNRRPTFQDRGTIKFSLSTFSWRNFFLCRFSMERQHGYGRRRRSHSLPSAAASESLALANPSTEASYVASPAFSKNDATTSAEKAEFFNCRF